MAIDQMLKIKSGITPHEYLDSLQNTMKSNNQWYKHE